MAVKVKKSNRLWKMAGGTILVLFSAPCVIAMLHDVIVGADNIEGALIVGSFCSMTSMVGAALIFYGLKTPAEDQLIITAQMERVVLEQARRQNGVLSVPLLAMETELSLEQSEALLDELSRRGYASPHVGSGGAVEFVFADFQPQPRLDDLGAQIERASQDAEQQRVVNNDDDW